MKATLESALADPYGAFATQASAQITICDKDDFQGRSISTICHVGNFAQVAFKNSASWVVVVGDHRDAPAPLGVKDFRRRKNDRPYQAEMSEVLAVIGPAEQRCRTEREPVPDGRGDAIVPAAIAGEVIGGIQGHQIGGGTGQKMSQPPDAMVSINKKGEPRA